jgi:hypothetical protein
MVMEASSSTFSPALVSRMAIRAEPERMWQVENHGLGW